MKATFYWEKHTEFFILPTVTVGTYDSTNFDWSRVFGITFIWLKFILCFEFKKRNRET